MRYFALIFFAFIQAVCRAQTFQVPSEMEFAGMKLKLSEPVKRALKADVELITKNPKYFQVKVERADIYFPMIESIFREQGFPEDFKYLALQESSLIADAVSSSNAVGYWQFKKETAREVGLRVDHLVDERMNIAASSRGAATYLKKNNFFLGNWVYALLSYNLGLGGVKPHVKDKYKGVSEMLIDEDMHWYVIRFLAHKLAYENAVGKPSPLSLLEEKSDAGKSLADFAYEKKIDAELLKSYNKWLLGKNAPSDKAYSFILPVDSGRRNSFVAQETKIKVKENQHEVKIKTSQAKVRNYQDISSAKSEMEKLGNDVPMFVKINKVKAIMAVKGDDIAKLALRARIKTKDLLLYNDLRKFDPITPGCFYYLQPKKNKALVLKHTVQKGEDVAAISQMYGIRQNAIRKKNRMDKRETPVPGRVLWLRMKRPESCPVEILEIPEVKVTKTEKQAIKVIADTSSRKTANTDRISAPKLHMVKAGETLYSISKMYNVHADSVKKWNRLPDNNLKPGQELIVEQARAAQIIHRVAAGETMYRISKMYGVSVAEIMRLNGKKDESLETGEELIIKKK